MTPIAMPAFAPPDVPSVACATGEDVADAVLEGTAAVLEIAATAGTIEEMSVVAGIIAADVGTALVSNNMLVDAATSEVSAEGIKVAVESEVVLAVGLC
jgi:hypothetical protein